MTLHPTIVRLLDGELSLADLPPELRADGERALAVMGLLDRAPVTLSGDLEARVMAAVRQRAASPARRFLRWWGNPQEVRIRVRPWLLGPALAVAVALVLLLGPRSGTTVATSSPATADSTLVRFVFHAPGAERVTLAGSFNDWSLEAAPLARTDGGVWTITVPLPAGQHEYAFVVDGRRWMPDPAAPTVDDGLGHRNSVMAVGSAGEASL